MSTITTNPASLTADLPTPTNADEERALALIARLRQQDWDRQNPGHKALRERIEAMKGTEETLNLATNPMLSRGTVYVCRIDENGNAVATHEYSWWSSVYSDTRPCTKRIGRVEIVRVSGSSAWTLKAGGMTEGRG